MAAHQATREVVFAARTARDPKRDEREPIRVI
jgi:hypothetical protein